MTGVRDMRSRHIDSFAHTDADASSVFALLADGSSWPRWAPIESFELEKFGDPPPEGVGAIRVFRHGRTTGRDQLVAIEPGRRLSYASLSGLPVHDYQATVHTDADPHRWYRHPLAFVVRAEDLRHRSASRTRTRPVHQPMHARSRVLRSLPRRDVHLTGG